MTQLVLIVDFELLRGFGLIIYFAYGRLIFPLVFVVTVIVIVARRRAAAAGIASVAPLDLLVAYGPGPG